ncbi:MerR family transcriptional regulator [Streptomyces sp. G45]|uniref:MerR family transcriptional regulator n=1 Tax=Streptomyces sp. G45 TaxID=3406627 RepID=UPI003C1787C9
MRIGDAAAAAGTTPRALRFYEQRGVLRPPRRTATGQRVYGPEDVARVRVIRQLLALGLTVEDIRGCADGIDRLGADGLPRPGEAARMRCGLEPGVAEQRIEQIDAEIARLTAQRQRLAGRVAAIRASIAGELTAADLAAAGLTVADLEAAGITTADLETTGLTAADLGSAEGAAPGTATPAPPGAPSPSAPNPSPRTPV